MNVDQAADRISQIIHGKPQQPAAEGAEPVQGAPANQELPQVTPDEKEPQTLGEAIDEAQEQAPDNQVAQEEEPEEEDNQQEPEQQDDAPDSVLATEDVAAALGLSEGDVDVDDDGNLLIKAKVDGELVTVSPKDLKDSYQLARTGHERLQKLSEDRKAFDVERSQQIAQLQSQQQQVAETLQLVEAELNAYNESVDWAALRQEDPSEYAARRADNDDRLRRVEAYKQQLNAYYQQQEHEQMQILRNQQAQGQQKLNEIFSGTEYEGAPTWDQSEQQRLVSWLKNQGFSNEDISSVSVWQVFKWARDSMLRESERSTAKKTAKKVVKLSKARKPKKAAPTGQQQAPSKVAELKKAQKKSGGSVEATARLMTQILRGQ